MNIRQDNRQSATNFARIVILFVLSSAICFSTKANAAEDKYGIEIEARTPSSDAADEGYDEPAVNQQIVDSTEEDLSGPLLRRAAEDAIKRGEYDKALKRIRLSLKKNYDDSESHKTYAIALEKKLASQESRDPYLFSQCVKEWLILLRKEVGFEKLTYHGLNAPLVGHFFADETLAIPAREHLKALTGILPRAWETDAQYLHRASRDDTYKTDGKVLKANIR